MRETINVLILLLCMTACVDPFGIKSTGSTRTLVVEGVVSSQLKNHQILLSRSTALDNRTLIPERGANVFLTSDANETLSLNENSPGIYETPEFAAEPGHAYVLHIKTSDGSVYESREVKFTDGPEIGHVYPKYIDNPNGDGKGIQIYVDSEDTNKNSHYFRWNYVETYEIHAPFPSNWVWLGGNSVEFRHEGLDTCYVVDTLRNVLIRSTKGLEQDKITGQRLRYIPDFSYILRYRYSILVQQFSLSEEAYQYWDNLRTMSERQGSLSDIQPGSLEGNLSCITNPDEGVLGYFEVCKVSEKRIFFSAIDFYDQGLLMPKDFRSYCYDIAPTEVHESVLGEAMTRYERTMLIWEVYGFNPNAVFELMPKSCCDCRDMGPTERPPYF